MIAWVRARATAADGVFVLVAVSSILSFWIAGLLRDPIDVLALYRYGDYQYFPLLAGLLDGTLGDPVHLEDHGRGLVSFPLPSLLPHAIALAFFGTWGFVVMDVALVVLMYGLSLAVFTATVRRSIARVLALCTACASFGLLGRCLDAVGVTLDLDLWGFRFPRPLVADLYVMASVLMLLRLTGAAHQLPREWGIAGATLGLAVQANPWSGFTLMMGFSLAALHQLGSRYRDAPTRVLPLLAPAAAAFGAVMTFYALQRLMEAPSIPPRLGLFEVARSAPLYFEPTTSLCVAPIAWTAAALALGGRADAERTDANGAWRGALVWLALLAVISSVALPLSCVVLGKTIQPYHFHESARTFRTLSLLASLAVVADVLHGSLAATSAGRGWATGRRRALVGGAAVTLIGTGQLAWTAPAHARAARLETFIRPVGGQDFRALMPWYDASLRTLLDELRRPEYADAEVLGTFDTQVGAWWTLLHGGRLFAPDVFTTTADDETVERRLLRLCSVLQMEPEQVGDFLGEYDILNLFVGHAKYQASAAHTFAPRADYTPGHQRMIDETHVLDTWVLLLPRTERRRLVEQYRGLQADAQPLPRLDLIVVMTGPTQGELRPDPAQFRLTFENRVFRVFRAIAPP